ncbi:MAG: endonuclease domain-containing protein, partial [Geminocystis sp.]|nr:endonuclease domain-containing protein [Geminocystis sp.]
LEDPHPLTPSPREGEQEDGLAPLSPLRRQAGGEGLSSQISPHPLTPSPSLEGEQEEEIYWEISPALRQRMKEVARQFRKEPTTSEAILWEALRGLKLNGRKFKRQQPLGPFIVDFFCAAERLIVEIDGSIHQNQREADQQRQQLLESLGLRFVRLSSQLVENDLPTALSQISAAFLPPSLPP